MSIDLRPGERLIRRALGNFINQKWRLPVDGRVYLTDRRFVWKRAFLHLPRLAESIVEIPLLQITHCEIRGPALIIVAGDTEYWFYIRSGILALVHYVHGKTTKEWLEAIHEAAAAPNPTI
ncbi:MAG: hypothetical protein WEE64_02055 [Dehalococcoidia bacterium]